VDEIYRFKLTDLDRFRFRTGAKVILRAEDGDLCYWDDVEPRLTELIDMHNADVLEIGRLHKEIVQLRSEKDVNRG